MANILLLKEVGTGSFTNVVRKWKCNCSKKLSYSYFNTNRNAHKISLSCFNNRYVNTAIINDVKVS